MPSISLTSWRDGSLEKRYRKKRQRDNDGRVGKKGTFDGYMPVHSVFDKWRATLLREKKSREEETSRDGVEHDTATNGLQNKKRMRRRRELLPPLPRPKVALAPEDVDELLSLGSTWKFVKLSTPTKIDWTDILESMTKEYNALLAEYHTKKNSTSQTNHDKNAIATVNEKNAHAALNLPPLFRIQNDGNDENNRSNRNTFYICASIGEPKDGRFQVLVDEQASSSAVSVKSTSPLPELRPSLTKCTVLSRGFMHDAGSSSSSKIPVTKVLLQPWTGRRHQLRVHLAHVAGCPILGDAAYGGNLSSDDANGQVNNRGVCSRMCLHAKQLEIPLIGNESKMFVAEDPFVVMKNDDCDYKTLVIP